MSPSTLQGQQGGIAPPAGPTLWTQHYHTDDSDETVGFIDCVPDPTESGPAQYIVRVLKGTVRCDSMEEAETWLQQHVWHERHVKGGVKLIRG
jgi:hypothetical protein